ncbi:hypothetical protein [Streptomyces sp. 147326]|uniref:hypothetical protein n=1 Tax=Streptomyces sp. 147326 TaxID=3074379 RepID=UPI003857826C
MHGPALAGAPPAVPRSPRPGLEPGPTKAAPPAPPSPTPPAVTPTAKAPEPTITKPATPEPPQPAKRTIREQSGSKGSPTFLDPHGAKGPSGRIPAHSWIEVECRVYAPEIETANPDGWWYRIASHPWNGRYAVANTFMNGDTPGQTPATNTDWSVPVC